MLMWGNSINSMGNDLIYGRRKNENLIEFTTRIIGTNNLSTNPNLIVVESAATEP